MKNEKTREEIVAEREAKKKAKLMAKKKLNSTASTTTDDAKCQSASLGSIAKNIPSQQDQATPPVASNKGKKKDRTANKSETSVNVRSPKPESPDTINVNASPIQKTPIVSNQIKPAAPTNQHLAMDAATENDCRPAGVKGESKEKDLKGAEILGEEANKMGGPTKAEQKAARRLKQEMQRAAKAGQSNAKTQPEIETQSLHEAQEKPSEKKPVAKVAFKKIESRKNTLKPKAAIHKVKLFNHLYNDEELSINDSLSNLHPAIISLGMQYANKVIVGSNARCFSFMNALKRVIEDYTTPQQKEFARGLESCLQPCLSFLQRCRPLAVSMTNAMKHLKWQMTQLSNDVTDAEAKKKLQEAIDTYLRDQIDVAAQAICITVQKKISNGDVIVTYGCSSLVQRILIEAYHNDKKFRVVIVDARPLCEGLQLLHRLGQHGIRCSYVLIGAASCMMREATKVLLGAHALLANGYVMSRAGSSQVALLAHSYNVPVLVCCETYKFCERVQTDALVHNEIGDPDALVPCRSLVDKPLANWQSVANLTPLNLTYDVTPPDLVTAVITELAILPCTSVPVILRIKPTDSHH